MKGILEMNKTRNMALKIMQDSPERKEAEKMMGIAFEEMTMEQRILAAEVLAAFEDWKHSIEG